MYTCTVHWTVQLSRDQTELASVNSLYSVHFKKCPQTERSTGGLFNRDANRYGDICLVNICPGDICPYQEYLSCY